MFGIWRFEVDHDVALCTRLSKVLAQKASKVLAQKASKVFPAQQIRYLMHLMGFNVFGLKSYDFAERVPHQTIMCHFFLNLLKKPGLLLGRITVGFFPELSEPKCLRRLKAMSH